MNWHHTSTHFFLYLPSCQRGWASPLCTDHSRAIHILGPFSCKVTCLFLLTDRILKCSIVWILILCQSKNGLQIAISRLWFVWYLNYSVFCHIEVLIFV
jgi:hypothetical protein